MGADPGSGCKLNPGVVEMDVESIGDELAIRDLVARYADAVARGDAEAWAATWAEDGEWHIFGQPTRGRDAVVALWKTLMGTLSFVLQVPSSGIIRIDGARGTGRWHVTEHGKRVDGAATLTLGTYQDEYCRVGDGWRFRVRRFDALYLGPPDLSARALPRPADNQADGAGPEEEEAR